MSDERKTMIDFIDADQFRIMMSWYITLVNANLNTPDDDDVAKQLRKAWSDLIGV